MQVARFKAALALLCSCCKNGVYLLTIPSVLLTLKDGNSDFDANLVIDKENLRFLEGVMPLFDNKEHFMQVYQKELSLLCERAFVARCDCQNRKLLLKILHGSKAPENSTFSGCATGWIHSDHEEKQAAAAAYAQAVAALFTSKPVMPTPLSKIKKTPKTIKSKAAVGLDTDPETIIIDKDVKMKAIEESMVVDLDSNESDSMSINDDLPAKGATRGWATHKCHGQISKCAATHSPAPVTQTTNPVQCDSCGKEYQGLMKSDPMYHKAINILEKQDRILAERSNKHIHSDVSLMACSGDLGDNQLMFPLAAWSNQFQLQSKYKSVQDALKLLSVEHIQDGTLVSYQLHKRHLDTELKLLVHCLEATVVAYKFCDKQLTLVQAKIGCILCPDMSGEIRI
ncbi:hypothetical protein ARMGADRAFT_1085234 [Armillaria gallica]|uniref:Uncharacterized protein n=1 Tax=Armillaria gallica TaxID=47427 RepID=A0A2H3DAL0_ARMGA|nr:hypothetical protein ARMGADRAFT_1085234 [Armillaria gallica]